MDTLPGGNKRVTSRPPVHTPDFTGFFRGEPVHQPVHRAGRFEVFHLVSMSVRVTWVDESAGGFAYFFLY